MKRRVARTLGGALLFWSPLVLIVAAGFWVTARFIEPAPPRSAVILTGREDGEYYATAKKYVGVFKKNGIDLQVRPSAGSVDNYAELMKDDNPPDLAIVQGGTLSPEIAASGKLEAVASIYLEPLWVFYRDFRELDRIAQLKGRRVAIGLPGSGTHALATKLLSESGLDIKRGDVTCTETGVTEATQALKAGQIDACFIVSSPASPVIKELLSADGVRVMSNAQAEGLARRMQFLSVVTLYRGSVDPIRDLPARDVKLVAPTAMIIAREHTHKSVVLLAAMAASEIHKDGTLLNEAGKFPTDAYTELPMSRDAGHFLRNGPSFLSRILPFWLASLIMRLMILLVPLIGLLFPIVRATPPLYAWRIRSRIYRWYKQVQTIDNELARHPRQEALNKRLADIQHIEDDIRGVHVPLSYMEDLYHLRLHVDFIKSKIREELAAGNGNARLEAIAHPA